MMKIFIIIDIIIMSIMILFFSYVYLVPVRYICIPYKSLHRPSFSNYIRRGHSRNKKRISTDKLTIGKIITFAKECFYVQHFISFVQRTSDFGHNNIHSEYGSSRCFCVCVCGCGLSTPLYTYGIMVDWINY